MTNTVLRVIGKTGILLYIGLYLLATVLYTGGNNTNKNAKGFDWSKNYWCELIAETGKNGQPNKAYHIAIIAAIVLFVSLTVFWIVVPPNLIAEKSVASLTTLMGVGSMIVGLLMLTEKFHDLLISIAGLLGVLAIALVLYYLYKAKRWAVFFLGIFCVLLCGINNYVYYTGHFIDQLPIIQKFTFIFFLVWFGWLFR